MRKIILIMFVQILFLSCISDVKTGFPEETNNISESKRKKYFEIEYTPSQTDFNVNDTVYKITEVWAEQAWTYKNADMVEEKLKYSHFLIRFNREWVDKINYKNENFENNGYGFRREKMRFILTEKERKKDTLKLYFFINKDTIPVIFIKKK